MSNYDHTLSITIPNDLYDIGCAIAKSLDPDVGGERSFGTRTVVDPLTGDEVFPATYTASTPCTAEFYAQGMYLLANPDALFAAVSADYAARWPELVPPTLVQCYEFCAAAVLPPVAVVDAALP